MPRLEGVPTSDEAERAWAVVRDASAAPGQGAPSSAELLRRLEASTTVITTAGRLWEEAFEQLLRADRRRVGHAAIARAAGISRQAVWKRRTGVAGGAPARGGAGA